MPQPKPRVLVVDDSSINLSIMEEMLSSEFRLAFAQNGHDALLVARQFRPHIVLLDVMMPGIDGLDTCRHLRSLPGMDQTAIIFVSAKAMPSEQAAGMDAGANDYLTKPFDDNDLWKLLRRYSTTHQDQIECRV